jgi:hypothetical protein
MAAKKMTPPGTPPAGEMPPKDFAEALESAPEEMSESPMEEDEETKLDAEQQALADQMGFSAEEAGALKRFIQTCSGGMKGGY